MRPYVFPPPVDPLPAADAKQSASKLSAAGSIPTATRAEAYYQKGILLARDATVDLQTAKVTYPPGCVEAFRKYLELDPNGSHAKEVKGILAAGSGIKTR